MHLAPRQYITSTNNMLRYIYVYTYTYIYIYIIVQASYRRNIYNIYIAVAPRFSKTTCLNNPLYQRKFSSPALSIRLNLLGMLPVMF